MTYSTDIINLCFLKLHNKEKHTDVATCLNISISTIRYWLSKYNNCFKNYIRITDDIINNYKTDHPHKSIKRLKFTKQITEYVEANEGCSLDDISKKATNSMISKPTICRVLKELNITNKKINNYIVCKEVDKIIAERIEYSKTNAEKIKNSLDDVNIDNFNKSICIDESSFLVSDITRYGYSKKGTSINKLIKHKKNKERYNLLMAISTDGVVGYEISAKPFNTDKYIEFITKYKNVFNGKTILQDNVRFHHARRVKSYTTSNNIKMEYIPAYSPIFNPIEMVFSKVKSVYRKLEHTNIVEDIKHAISKVTSTDTANCYAHTVKTINEYAEK